MLRRVLLFNLLGGWRVLQFYQHALLSVCCDFNTFRYQFCSLVLVELGLFQFRFWFERRMDSEFEIGKICQELVDPLGGGVAFD